jgi:hypothetical protein
MEKLRADGRVCHVDDEQADLHEEGSLERDWVFREAELDLRCFVFSTSARILPNPAANVVFGGLKRTGRS